MFQYEPELKGFQRDTFNAVTRQIKSIKGNQYDAAVTFMMVQLDNGPSFESSDDNWKRFRRKLITDAAYCSDHAALQDTKDVANGLFNDMANNEDTNSY